MTVAKLKYYTLCCLLLCIVSIRAQDQAVVTIIGDDPIEANNTHDFVNTNAYPQNNEPPDKKLKLQKNEMVIPSLENGFHMRFEVSYDKPSERLGGTGGAAFASSSEYDRTKKRSTSLTERKFNIKKRLKKWIPTRKRRYRPTLCGRF